jgi:hypothetical protein
VICTSSLRTVLYTMRPVLLLRLFVLELCKGVPGVRQEVTVFRLLGVQAAVIVTELFATFYIQDKFSLNFGF